MSNRVHVDQQGLPSEGYEDPQQYWEGSVWTLDEAFNDG